MVAETGRLHRLTAVVDGTVKTQPKKIPRAGGIIKEAHRTPIEEKGATVTVAYRRDDRAVWPGDQDKSDAGHLGWCWTQQAAGGAARCKDGRAAKCSKGQAVRGWWWLTLSLPLAKPQPG